MKRAVCLVLATLVVVGAGYAACQASAWRQRAEAALQQADSALVVARAAEAREAELVAVNDSLVTALSAERRRIRERVVEVRAVEDAPDSCAVFIAWRDRVIDDLTAEADGWRQAWQREREARQELRVAYDALAVSHDSLTTVLRAAPGVAPSFFERLVPDLRVGAFVGVNTNGRPTAGVGLVAGWEVF